MNRHILLGNPSISLVVRRSERTKRIKLAVSRIDGQVTLTLPPYVAESSALEFARSKENWIRAQIAKSEAAVDVGPGMLLPVEGQYRKVEMANVRRPKLRPDRFLLPEGLHPGAAAQAHLQPLAEKRLVAAANRYSFRLGRSYAKLAVRDTRSRWGSCSEKRTLSFSWRLILAPPDVLKYVAAHEVAHLQEMNHSETFWKIVRQLYGSYNRQRRWLREQGSELHTYRFNLIRSGSS